ncbi:MAG: ATP synthase F1 subunit epsilon [Polyangiales bacterium]|nr:ATP synthase F1 subunit epsilon [Myxococcales bacterium]
MATILTLEVTTPRGLALRTETDYVQAPSVEGELGVLPNHLPVLAAIRCGLLKYKSGGQVQVAAVGPGFLQAEPDRVVLLSDLFATPEKIDVDATKQELVDANEALKTFGERHEGAEYDELKRNIDWAQAKLDAVAEAGKN